MFRNELKQSIVPFCRLSAHMLAITLTFFILFLHSYHYFLEIFFFS